MAEKVKIVETTIQGGQFKIAVMIGGFDEHDPSTFMDEEVRKYVGDTPHNVFVESHLDTPWVRVVMSGINDITYEDFENQKL